MTDAQIEQIIAKYKRADLDEVRRPIAVSKDEELELEAALAALGDE